MTELEIMKHAKDYVDMLANGIDPISEKRVEDDNFINNVRISRCLSFVSDVLQKVINNGGEIGKKVLVSALPFTITQEQTSNIPITNEAVGISDFTKRINAVISEDVKPLSATHITRWLLQNGYLSENIYNGKKRKVVTPKGTVLGITTIESVGKTGIPYQKNIYNSNAQRFIASNLNQIESEFQFKKSEESAVQTETSET